MKFVSNEHKTTEEIRVKVEDAPVVEAGLHHNKLAHVIDSIVFHRRNSGLWHVNVHYHSLKKDGTEASIGKGIWTTWTVWDTDDDDRDVEWKRIIREVVEETAAELGIPLDQISKGLYS